MDAKKLRIGDLVSDNGTIGTVKCLDGGVVVAQFGRSAETMKALSLFRAGREWQRVGMPPSLRPGDVVVVDGQRWQFRRHLQHGAIVVGDAICQKEIQWPHYRKAKKDKGGLGKFQQGDLLTFGDGSVVYEVRHMQFGKFSMANRRLCCVDPNAGGMGGTFYFYPSQFASFRRLPKEKPPLIPTNKTATAALADINARYSGVLGALSKHPMSHSRVNRLQNVLDLVKGFAAEKDGAKASRILEKVFAGLALVSDVCTFASYEVDCVFDHRTVDAIPVEKVNANS